MGINKNKLFEVLLAAVLATSSAHPPPDWDMDSGSWDEHEGSFGGSSRPMGPGAISGAISISKLTELNAGDDLATFRRYTTFYQQQVGLMPEDVVLTYGLPCLNMPRIDSPFLLQPYDQITSVYANVSLKCEDFGGIPWGGVQRTWPRGLQAFDLLMQYGGMVRKELTQRTTHANAVLTAAVEAYKNVPGGRDITLDAPTDAEEWAKFWATLSAVSLAPQDGLSLKYGIAPAPESIMPPYNQNGPIADLVPSDINDPMTDEFLENNVGNAYAHEWVSYEAGELIAKYPEVANLPRFEQEQGATYVALDLARWMAFTGKYQDTNFLAGIKFPPTGNGTEVTIRDLPVLVVRHRAPDHPRPFKVIGIVMTSYDNKDVKTLYYPSDGQENICENTWTIAKMHFNAAYMTFMAISHFYQTHYFPFTALAIGLERDVNRAHPLSRLLHSNTWRNVGIAWNGLTNVFDGKTGLFSQSTIISGPDVAVHIYPEMAKLEEYNLPNPMDVFRTKLHPDVREDMKIVRYSRMYFRAFRRFARDFVNAFYGTDADVLDDYELQTLASELVDPNRANLNAYGFLPPSFFTSKDALIEFLARSLYAQGFLHHVMNHKLLTTMGLHGMPYRSLATHKFFFPNPLTGALELGGIPPQNNISSSICNSIDVTDYTGLSLLDAIPEAAPQTFTYLQAQILSGEAFKPTFFDLQDLHAFGYPHEQYDEVRRANARLARRLRYIDQVTYEKEGQLSLKEGGFQWVPAWGTVTQPVI